MTFEDLKKKIAKMGFYYSDEVLLNYYISLISKPFVILSGISGSGKSKIAELFSVALSYDGEKRFELVPVMPSWRDSKSLFGYHNLIDNTYNATPVVKLFIKALQDKENPYFIILDEMNLAKVEQYFADYLSVIESRRILSEDTIENKVKNCYVKHPELKLSEAIILSAIDINKPYELLDIAQYRENLFSKSWKEQNFHGQETNWTPQYRTELNQKDSSGNPQRLAGKIFEGNNGRYKINLNLPSSEQKIVDNLRLLYDSLSSNITQNNIVLHNSNKCISVDSDFPCACENCTLPNEKKYMCPKLCNSDTFFIPPEIPIPLNVFTIGTVNVDETTFMFSPKVLDRCNVIEFNEIDILQAYNLPDKVKNKLRSVNSLSEMSVQNADFELNLKVNCANVSNTNTFSNNNPDLISDLLCFFETLKKYNLHFGYRVINEISCYMNTVSQIATSQSMPIAFDIQICQKILPKLAGTYDSLWVPLKELLSLCQTTNIEYKFNNISELESELNATINKILNDESTAQTMFKYPRSARKILEKLSELDAVGFTASIK